MAGQNFIVIRYPTKGARKVLDRQAARLPAGFRKGLDELTEMHKEELEAASPEGETKQLKEGWRVRKSGAGGRARNVIYNVSGHLGLVVKGTKPHVIRAKHVIAEGPRAGQLGYLRFRSKEGGFAFVHEVQHPGTAPNPFQRTAIARAQARAHGVMKQAVVRTLRLN